MKGTKTSPDAKRKLASAKRAEQYLKAWRKRNWRKMAGYTQKTWAQVIHNGGTAPSAALAETWSGVRLKSWRILNVHESAPCLHTVDVELIVDFGGSSQSWIVAMNLIQESAPQQPSPDGHWGVNPVSVQMNRNVGVPYEQAN